MSLYEAAKRYKGVRFVHRGRTRRGLDCAGLVWRAALDCGVELPDFRLYDKEPSAHGPVLTDYMVAALGSPLAIAPVRQVQLCPDAVVVFRFEVEPHHVAIVGPYPLGGLSVIHADGHNNKVVEHRLSPDMIRRITHVFRSPV